MTAWSKEPPGEPGWWWYRKDAEADPRPYWIDSEGKLLGVSFEHEPMPGEWLAIPSAERLAALEALAAFVEDASMHGYQCDALLHGSYPCDCGAKAVRAALEHP